MGPPVRSLLGRPFALVSSSWPPVPRFFAANAPTDRFRLRSLLGSLSKALTVAHCSRHRSLVLVPEPTTGSLVMGG
jgi:hypothetical protein